MDRVDEVKKEVRRSLHENSRNQILNDPCYKGFCSVYCFRDSLSLEVQFLDLEIKEAVWGCEGSKSPGPNGYNFFFVKKCWHFMKEDFF